MSGILQKYIDLQVIDDAPRVQALTDQFATMTDQEHALHYAGSKYLGHAFIKDSPGTEQAILEVVMASDAKDSFATLFRPHPLFNSRDTYREGRQEMYEMVLDFADASVAGLAIKCPQRKRVVMVRDLGFIQLLQLVRSYAASWQR